jgi:hypothetical protein
VTTKIVFQTGSAGPKQQDLSVRISKTSDLADLCQKANWTSNVIYKRKEGETFFFFSKENSRLLPIPLFSE